ncbi:leucyl/phenylalanyl-tRNA--protein transferase [Nocardioides sp.]|uniref:leucyl/phenylalanyl-tRNA--protein transferase n=1 Tax=Nocardioides sp. TaxID=35761 RepID=UPI002B2723D4|nr:leucyl/phenylalanyl-tRNA--protein transferase [Nocardioides sp.]
MDRPSDAVPAGSGPVEPPVTRWVFSDINEADADEDLVAIGADLEPGTILAAYRRGLFPMPFGTGRRAKEPMGWWSPVQRGVLELDDLHVSRSLRRSLRDFEIRIDTAFTEVIEACADPDRPHGWIDRQVREAYVGLHALGWAHSVEAWQDGRLVGGLYGLALGGLFAGESMFHRTRDASKAALVGLVDVLRDEHAEARLIDVQWQTPHLETLGVSEVPRDDYLARLDALLAVPLPAAFAPRR